jgi:dihydroxy-acid dehydratase
MNLRSNFEPGSTRWAVRRAQWLAMGLSEEDLLKPKIAVVNTSSKLSVCFAHLDDISVVVQRAVRDAGGVPFEIRTAAPSDFVTSAGRQGRYLMPTRDLIVNDIEVQVEGALLDGMVLLSSCDKSTPAHLMAAGRLDIPALILVCGYQLGGHCAGRPVDIEDVYNSVGAVKAGKIKLEELKEMTCYAIQAPGVCAGLATANTMHVIAEALGMALSGSTPIRAGSPCLIETAARAGTQIVKLVERGSTARQILTPAAIRNALKVAIVLGGSVNCIRHLTATASETECAVDVLSELERLSARLPLLARIRPNGPDRIETLDAAGGCRGVMKQLERELELDALTVNGECLGDLLARTALPDARVIRPLSAPMSPEPGLTLIRGNLAPGGAIVKLAAVPETVRRFRGQCRVFEDESRAIASLGDGTIKAGEVIVLRMMGPVGGPGTVFAASFMAALVGAGLSSSVAVVTDGELSGLNSGITIGQVMPEAAEGGPLAVVRDDDWISIDLTARRIDLDIEADELAARLRTWDGVLPPAPRGWLSQYRSLVRPLAEGAVLKPLRRLE